MGASIDTPTRGKRARHANLNLVPYVDVLMTLMAFLILTAAWTQLSALETQQSSKTAPTEEEPPAPAVLVLNRAGVSVDGVDHGRDWSAVEKALHGKAQLEIRVDDGVRYDEVTRAVDVGTGAGIDAIRVVTSEG